MRILGVFVFLLLGLVLFTHCSSPSESEKYSNKVMTYNGRHSGTSFDSAQYFADQAILTANSDLEIAKALCAKGLVLMYSFKLDSGFSKLNEARKVLLEHNNNEYLSYNSHYIGFYYRINNNLDSAIYYYFESQDFLQFVDDPLMLQSNQSALGSAYRVKGDYPKALKHYQKSLEINHSEKITIGTLISLTNIYLDINNNLDALKYAKKAEKMANENPSRYKLFIANDAMASAFASLNKSDSAIIHYEKALDAMKGSPSHTAEIAYFAGQQAFAVNDFQKALSYFKYAIANSNTKQTISSTLSHFHAELARTYDQLGILDSAEYSAQEALRLMQKTGQNPKILHTAEFLSEYYQKRNEPDSTIKYLTLVNTLREEMFNSEIANKIGNLTVEIATLNKEKELQSALREKAEAINHRQNIIMISGAVFLIICIVFIWLRKRFQLKALIAEEEQQKLRLELDKNQQLLSTQTLNMIHKNNGFSEISETLEANNKGQNIRRIINMNMSLEKDWNNFNDYFYKVHKGFYEKIIELHPSITINDKRLCALVKLGLKNKEIATILNVKFESVKMAKYRLKQRLDLSEEINLTKYLDQLV